MSVRALSCKTIIGVMSVVFYAGACYAGSEEEKAQQACKDVLTAYGQKADICIHNTRSESFWRCIEQRSKEGEGFAFASNQCEKEG